MHYLSNVPYVNIQVDVNSRINQNSEFQAKKQHFETLLKGDDSYFIDLTVGKNKPYLFKKDGSVIIYSLVAEKLEQGIKNYVIEIQEYLSKDIFETLISKEVLEASIGKDALKALISDDVSEHSIQPQRNRGRLASFKAALESADRIHFLVEIALAIAFVSALLAPKIFSKDVSPEMNNNVPVAEHQTPKLPENKQIKR